MVSKIGSCSWHEKGVSMVNKFLKWLNRKKKRKAGLLFIILMLVLGTAGIYERVLMQEMPVYTADPVSELQIEEEEVPLAAKPVTTTKTSKQVTTTKKTLHTKSKKTYSKTLPTTTKTTTKTTKSTTKTVKKQTTVKVSVKEYYYKNKKYKKVVTTTVTTVKTTTTPVQKTTAASTAAKGRYEVSIAKIAPKMNANVRKAFTTLGFKVYIDSSVNYAGHCDIKNRTITLKKEDDTIYHELGHFLAFISGNTDTSSSFMSIYKKEKNKYTGTNKAYVIQDSSEYFAESVCEYTLSAKTLKNKRPKTYAAVQEAMDKITTERIKKLKAVYAVIWD